MLVVRFLAGPAGSWMKNSPGDRVVPREKKHRHRAERRAALPSGVEEVHGGGTSIRDESVCHAIVVFCQVFQLSALSSSDESLCQFAG